MSKIKQYVENMFYNLPKTEEVLTLKAQLIEGMEEKYGFLIHSGLEASVAFSQVIEEFGNMQEICQALNLTPIAAEDTKELLKEYQVFRKKFSFGIAVGVALILLAAGLFPFLEEYVMLPDSLVVLIFLSMVAISVGIFVYLGTQNSKYEELLNLTPTASTQKEKNEQLDAVNGIIMMVSTICFLIAGFIYNLWAIAWIVFPIGGLICGILGCMTSFIKRK